MPSTDGCELGDFGQHQALEGCVMASLEESLGVLNGVHLCAWWEPFWPSQ